MNHHCPICGCAEGALHKPDCPGYTYRGANQRQFLYAAMTCHRDHAHGDSAECVPDTVVLGEN